MTVKMAATREAVAAALLHPILSIIKVAKGAIKNTAPVRDEPIHATS